jgi:hypothetical protein
MLSIITGFFDFRRQMNGLMEENRLLREELIGLYDYCEFLKKDRNNELLKRAKFEHLSKEKSGQNQSIIAQVRLDMDWLKSAAQKIMEQVNDPEVVKSCQEIIKFAEMRDGKQDS